MKRGEVWVVNFEPAVGGEIRKRRPAVIISNNRTNRHLNRVQVVPVSSRVEKMFACEAPLSLRGRPNKAKADQIATVSKKRLGRRVGRVSRTEMQGIERAVRVQLDL